MLKRLPENILNLYLIKIAKWFNLVMPVVVLFYQDCGMNMQQIFWLKSVYSIAIVAMEIPSGYIADVWGRKKTLIMGSILGSAGFAVYSFSSGFFQFAIAEIILGIGHSFVSGADSAMLFDSLKAHQRENEYVRYEGQTTSAGNFAEAFAGIAGGLLAAVSLRAPFIAQAFVAGIGIPAAFLLKEPQHIAEQVKTGFRDILRTVRFSFAHKELRAAMLLSSVTGTATLTFAWFVQPFFKEAGLPLALFGLGWTLLNLSVGVFSMYAYRAESWLGQKRSLHLIIILIAASYILSGFSICLAGMVFLLLFYIVRGIATPILKNYIHHHTDSKVRATILSVRDFAIRINFAIVGPFLGYLTDHFSLKTALIVMGGIYLLTAYPCAIPFLRKST